MWYKAVCVLSGLLILASVTFAEEATVQPPPPPPAEETTATDVAAPKEGEPAQKPVSAVDIQKRTDFLRKAAIYWRDQGDEAKARFFEERAAAIEAGEVQPAPGLRPRKPEAVEGRGPADVPDKAQDKRGAKPDKAAKKGRPGSPVTEAIMQRYAELNEELAKAQAAGDEARSTDLAERVGLLRTIIFQDAAIREQAGRIAELERDISAIKDLLKRLAAAPEPKGE